MVVPTVPSLIAQTTLRRYWNTHERPCAVRLIDPPERLVAHELPAKVPADQHFRHILQQIRHDRRQCQPQIRRQIPLFIRPDSQLCVHAD